MRNCRKENTILRKEVRRLLELYPSSRRFIVRILNSKGIVTATGCEWTIKNLRMFIVNNSLMPKRHGLDIKEIILSDRPESMRLV